jgi:DNA (cytosine-5)-methyltransferase 1
MHRILLPDGRRRKLRVKEAARLQGFPDWFKFSGGNNCGLNQIGQSVPPVFSRQMANCIASYLEENCNEQIKNNPIST